MVRDVKNKSNFREHCLKLYEKCPKCGYYFFDSFSEKIPIELHHLYSQGRIENYHDNYYKFFEYKDALCVFIDSLLNVVPLCKKCHDTGSCGIGWNDVEFKKIIFYLQNKLNSGAISKKDLTNLFNFKKSSNSTMINTAIVFEVLDIKPFWFEKFM